jgi:signal peptidase I
MMRRGWNIQVTGWLRWVVGRRPLLTLVRLVVVMVLYFGAFRAMFVPVRVTGGSMEPSYPDGKVKLLNRWAYRGAVPARGDVVGFRKDGTRLVIMKRIVAVPGERVRILGGRVFVNGLLLDEPYAEGAGIPASRREVALGDDEYFAIGDNRQVTEYGVVKRHEILGRTR